VSLDVQFENLLALSRLPWFGVKDGRLSLTDASIGPVIDAHTHVALAYVRPMSVDLDRRSEVQHYLPSCCRINLDVYANKNFRPDDLAAMKRDLTLMSVTGRGMRATHTSANLVAEMSDLGIAHSVLLPIDFPFLSDNASVALREGPRSKDRLIPFGSVHPLTPKVGDVLDGQVKRGARGIKMHPNIQSFRPDARSAMRVYSLAAEQHVPIILHCGPVGIEPALGRYFTQVRHYEKPIRENPHTTFILAHAGALQVDEALELQRRYTNVVLETSCQSVSAVKRLVEQGDPSRIVHGSDWPFYHQGMALARTLIATEGHPEIRRKVLYENIERLLGLE
jgi:uncharacterized protein